MPHSSLAVAELQSLFTQIHSVRCEKNETHSLATLLGLSPDAMPLILPMLWLGKSNVSRALNETVAENQVALHEAQEFFYTRAFTEDEICTAHIALHAEDASEGLRRLLMSADFVDQSSRPIVSMKSTIRVVQKPDHPQDVAFAPSKQRPMGPVDLVLPIIDQSMISHYAALSGDNNRVHLDPHVAQSLGLQNTIAHGMLLMGLAEQAFSEPNTALKKEMFPLRFSCRFLLPLTAGTKSGLTRKHQSQNGSVFERVTLLSDSGPHVLATIHFNAR
jgi:acyl dehydratase